MSRDLEEARESHWRAADTVSARAQWSAGGTAMKWAGHKAEPVRQTGLAVRAGWGVRPDSAGPCGTQVRTRSEVVATEGL